MYSSLYIQLFIELKVVSYLVSSWYKKSVHLRMNTVVSNLIREESDDKRKQRISSNTNLYIDMQTNEISEVLRLRAQLRRGSQKRRRMHNTVTCLWTDKRNIVEPASVQKVKRGPLWMASLLAIDVELAIGRWRRLQLQLQRVVSGWRGGRWDGRSEDGSRRPCARQSEQRAKETREGTRRASRLAERSGWGA